MPPTLPPTPADIAAAAEAHAAELESTISEPQVQEPAPETPAQTPDLTQGEPILVSGSSGPFVRRLVELLAACGHATNSIIAAENPAGVLDNTVMKDVSAFITEHNIVESPGLEIDGLFVGPEAWKALYKTAAEKLGL